MKPSAFKRDGDVLTGYSSHLSFLTIRNEVCLWQLFSLGGARYRFRRPILHRSPRHLHPDWSQQERDSKPNWSVFPLPRDTTLAVRGLHDPYSIRLVSFLLRSVSGKYDSHWPWTAVLLNNQFARLRGLSNLCWAAVFTLEAVGYRFTNDSMAHPMHPTPSTRSKFHIARR
jgi:hypothetical protein